MHLLLPSSEESQDRLAKQLQLSKYWNNFLQYANVIRIIRRLKVQFLISCEWHMEILQTRSIFMFPFGFFNWHNQIFVFENLYFSFLVAGKGTNDFRTFSNYQPPTRPENHGGSCHGDSKESKITQKLVSRERWYILRLMFGLKFRPVKFYNVILGETRYC